MKLNENKWAVVVVLVVSFFISCEESPQKAVKEKTVFYYLTYSERGHNGDTIKYEDANLTIDTLDSFVGESAFFINKEAHIIRSYTSDNHAATDGGVLYFTLDNLGVIYLRSTTWYSSVRLHSNNDSINNLLIQAYSHIILIPRLNGCNWHNDRHITIKFSEPVVED